MNNRTVGKIGAFVTGLAVLAFAISMVFGLYINALFASCLSSVFIAIGFILLSVSLSACNENPEKKAVGAVGVAFSVIYAVLIFIVYYSEITTVRMNGALSKEALSIISYDYLGSLFFNYNLLGYAFMGLATFFIGFSVIPKDKGDKVFRGMLWGHGVFFISCFIVPMLPVFTTETSSIVGTVLLETWCAYFLPVCILGYRYFHKQLKAQPCDTCITH